MKKGAPSIQERQTKSEPKSRAASGWRRRLRGEPQDCLAHFLAGLEFDHGALRDRHVRFGPVWIPADAGFTNLDLEDAEVWQFDFFSVGERSGNVIKGLLDHIEHLLLH